MSKRIAIVYVSWHGHVRAIAERFALIAAARGAEATLIDLGRKKRSSTDGFDAVVVAGSIHFGKHSRMLTRFVERKLATLSSVPTAFVSVSGSAVSLQGGDQAEKYVHEFLRLTGWQPDQFLTVAGAVPFTRYDPFTKMLMRFTSLVAGRGTDTSRDYDYTNWAVVEAFIHGFFDLLERAERRSVAS